MFITCEALKIIPVLIRAMFDMAHSPLLLWVLPEYVMAVTGRQVTLDQPYELPRLKVGASSKLIMGLRRLQRGNWLAIDRHYLPEHRIRAALLREHEPSVLQCLPGSEGACEEVLATVCSYLTTRYPAHFKFSGSGQNRMIRNLITGDRFSVANNPRPLMVAATLAMEDFNILVQDPSNGEWRLQASATLFPAGWKLGERIGFTMADLHQPVPNWGERLGRSVNQFFDRLTTEGTMERHTLFVQTTPDLFQDDSLCVPSSLSCPVTGRTMQDLDQDGSRISNPHSGFSNLASPAIPAMKETLPAPTTQSKTLLPSDIHIRRERQTFNRLPLSNAILFTVHTYIMPLTSLDDGEFAAFMDVAGRWEDDMASYKGRQSWWPTVQAYALERAQGAEGANMQ